jgi:hypothetical protein
LKRESDLLVAEEEKKRQMMVAKPQIEQREVLLRNKEIDKRKKQVRS